MCSVPLILSLLLPSASAFAPSEGVWIGIEPQRIQHVHPAVQADLRRSGAWRRFAETDGVGWRVRFDEATRTPRWLWGRGIAVPHDTGADAAAAVAKILHRHAALLGIDDAQLALKTTSYSADVDTWYLGWDVLRDGLPTYRGGITARIKHGKLLLVHNANAAGADLRGSYHLTEAQAAAIAIAEGPAPDASHTDVSTSRVLLQRHDRTGLYSQRVYQIATSTAEPPGRWISFVDAESGELLNVHNEVRFITGTVSAEHRPRTVDGSPLITSPVPSATVVGDVDADVTDDAGVYDVTAGAQYATDLDGDRVNVVNDSGPDGLLVSASPDMTWTTADATQAEIDTYVAVHQVLEWGELHNPTAEMVTDKFRATVNISGFLAFCNAFYNGNINFYEAGGGCNNTGEIADVVHHEWGHGFHDTSIEVGGFDGSLSEGASDVVAFLQSDSPLIGPYFFTNGDPVRDVAPDRIYPQDYSNNPFAVHDNGLIFGGTMWDLLQLLQARDGDPAGTALTSELLAGILKGGTDIPGTYYEALVTDDDDGDLSNGTPNQCEILDAFGSHGLGDLVGGGRYEIDHVPLAQVPAGVPATVDVDVIELASSCFPLTNIEASVHYRVNGGAWTELIGTVSGTDITADIPAQPLGSFVEYYVEGTDDQGGGFSAPQSGAIAPFSFFAGDVIEVSCEDFEADDGGYTHSLLYGTVQDGADDWEWGAPTGAGGDPSFAYSGTNVWGNDLGQPGFNGTYQPNKINQLLSDTVAVGHYTDLFLQYQRWLNVEDGVYDQAVILANGQEVWNNHLGGGGEHHQDGQWVSHSVDLQGQGDMDQLEIAWEIHSDGGLEFGGWTIDDVCVYAPATADNRLGIVDFEATDLGGPIGLTWTNPVHGPIDEVVVVRRTDRYPDGFEDGEIVATVTGAVPGEISEVEHPNYDGSAGYYAVYAGDGTEWLSWTVEGWNAGFVEANEGQPTPGTEDTDTPGTDTDPGTDPGTNTDPGTDPGTDPDDTDKEEPGGCGCAAGPAPSVPWLALGLLGLLGRRRR